MISGQTNITVAAGQIRQKSPSDGVLSPHPFYFHIDRFHTLIDRLSVSQHETALLIFGAIPVLVGLVISL
jgi:hypothetical protein